MDDTLSKKYLNTHYIYPKKDPCEEFTLRKGPFLIPMKFYAILSESNPRSFKIACAVS